MSLSDNYIEFLPKEKTGAYETQLQIIDIENEFSIKDSISKQAVAFIHGILGEQVEVCTFEDACHIQKMLQKAENSSIEKRTLRIDDE